jgi:hypothetical protein
MKQSLLTAEMIAAFGKAPTRLPTGASSGIPKREWDRVIRGDELPVESTIKPAPRSLHLRAGHGAVR